MSSSSGWIRVLAGAQLVAEAAARRAAQDVGRASGRAAAHAQDVGHKAGTAALASEQLATLQRAAESLVQQCAAAAAASRAPSRSRSPHGAASSQDAAPQEAPIDLKGYDWADAELEALTKQTEATAAVHGKGSDTHVTAAAPMARGTKRPEELPTAPGTESQPLSRSSPIQTMPASQNDSLPVTEKETGLHSDQTSNLVASENQIISSDTPHLAVSPDDELDLYATRLQEGKAVPSTRIGRAVGFASLGAGLAYGTAMEGLARLLGTSSASPTDSVLVNDANADRLTASLCRMRGAALKMGQMLSIQDEALLPAPLARALRRVRQGADAMPRRQLLAQLEAQLGRNWRDQFVEFDERPFAAASIGQVHRAVIRHGDALQRVVVKVQYPGVASSIQSDLRNLGMLVKWTGLAPKGLFIENVIRVGEKELQVECDYRREMLNQRRIKTLIESDPVLRANKFVVPDVVMHLTSEQVLTSEFMPGGTIDKVSHLSQDERNRIGRNILYLTMKELFEWRFMQTDPNWGNFLYDAHTQTTSLIDFGATREFSKEFVDGYLRIVWASANRDEESLMKQSYAMSFLTGEENEQMLRAHKLSGYTVGEPFYEDAPFDFRGSNISTRMGEHTSVFLSHRLTPPPEEVYTLHRKLAGAYMLCIKLGAVIRCRDMLEDIVRNYKFDDGPPPKF